MTRSEEVQILNLDKELHFTFQTDTDLPILIKPAELPGVDLRDPQNKSINIMDVNNNTYQLLAMQKIYVWKIKKYIHYIKDQSSHIELYSKPNPRVPLRIIDQAENIELLNTEYVEPSVFGKTLQALKASEDMHVIVQVPFIADKFIPICVDNSNCTISDVKTKICLLLQFSKEYKFKFDDMCLDDNRNLGSYNVNKGQTLELVA